MNLAALGVDAVYGRPLDGLPVVEVPAAHAPLFAVAHRRLRRRPAGVHSGDGVVRDPATGSPVERPAPVVRWVEPPEETVEALRRAERPIVLAGPGVVESDAVPGLHAFAVAGSLGVLNTWGAKGVFDFRSRHHLATVGLQARDFELGGLVDADLIVLVGVDPLAEAWSRPRSHIEVPVLRAGLARVTQEGWAVDTGPLPPSKITQHYSSLLGPTGLVAADPGQAGYWVARTFGTQGLGGAQVPADPALGGFAIAAAIVARLYEPGRMVLAAVDTIDERAGQLLEVADRLGVPIAVEVWNPDGPELDAVAHLERLGRLVEEGGTVEIATDPTQLDDMIEVAGPIVAWQE